MRATHPDIMNARVRYSKCRWLLCAGLVVVSACVLLPNVAWVCSGADVDVPDETRLTTTGTSASLWQLLGQIALEVPPVTPRLVDAGPLIRCTEHCCTASAIREAIRIGAPRAPPATW